MSQPLIDHFLAIQALFAPYTMAYRGPWGECEVSYDPGQEDRALVLDTMLQDLKKQTGLCLQQGRWGLVFPNGPASFTGLRVVAAFCQGLAAGSAAVFCVPRLHEFWVAQNNITSSAVVYSPHHQYMSYKMCVQQKNGDWQYDLTEVPVGDVPLRSADNVWVFGLNEQTIGVQAKDLLDFAQDRPHLFVPHFNLWYGIY